MDSIGAINPSQYTNQRLTKDFFKEESLKREKITNKKEVTKEEIKQLGERINNLNKDVEVVIETHESLGDTMIKIVDKETNQIIVECPPKKILDLVAKLCELSGVKINVKA